ncbi:TPA: replicative DNA helicase [Patescibacteria group bacterium]|nr:replicative DNA helicase [Patescibacteria group bacterium]HCU47580.1 replicative DNA helicase [Patescibacteria group bacterium]
MAKTTDKLPPQNLEAEASTLGSLLIDKDAIVSVADILEPADFYSDNNGQIYESMMALYEDRTPIDVLSLGSKLQEKGILEAVGGHTYLTELANSVPTASNVVHYAKIVQRKSTLRKLLKSASEISQLAYQESDDIEEVLDKSESKLFSVSQKFYKQVFVPIKSVLTEAFDRIDDLHKEAGKLRGLATGFPDLDNLLAGFQKSDFIVLAARPSVGKTTLALDIARRVAIDAKIPVGIFSLEMSKEQLVDRLLCSEANVDLWRMRTGRLSDKEDDFPRIGHAMGVLSEAPIFIDDSATANVMEIRTKARRLQAEHGLGLLLVDYLQLLEGRNTENRVQEVSEITRGLKAIARELNIPVLALSQLARAVELSKPAIPKLAHLRESGSIEQDADVVMFIYRKAVDKNYQIDDIPEEQRHIAEIHIAKHRNGPTGLIRLFFDENKVTFRSLGKNTQTN